MTSLVVLAVLTAVVAALRSTWSPCGESVLSTITPVSEPGRGNRWGVTAAFFVLGAATAGAAVGALAAIVTPLSSEAGDTTLLVLAAITLAGAALLDQRSAGRGLPPRRRQLNERDSADLRGWVYGGWWGLQVGSGIATISMTAGVYATFVLAALTGNALAAITVGALFGLVRGLGVLPARRLVDVDALRHFHRRMDELDDPTRRAALTWLVTAAVAAALLAIGAPAPIATLAALGTGAASLWLSRPAQPARRSEPALP